MYHELRPFYRFVVPSVKLDAAEAAVWKSLGAGKLAVTDACVMLKECRMKGVELSTRSADLLATSTPEDQQRTVRLYKGLPLEQPTVVTCLGSLWLDAAEEGACSCLVIGTEAQQVYVLKSFFTEIEFQVQLPGVPVCIVTLGTRQADHRIFVACRDSCVYTIKNGTLSDYVIYCDGPILQIVCYDNLIVAASARNTLSYYKHKGKCEATVFLPSPVTSIATLLDGVTGKARGVVVTLSCGAVRVYVGKSLLNETQVYGKVTGMRFGRLGREDAALVLVMQNGSLVVEVLHRSACFEYKKIQDSGPPAEQDVPIPVPPLTSVFIAHAERERAYSVDVHRLFQRDLTLMRLSAAKAFLSLMSSKCATGGTESDEVVAARSSRYSNSIRVVTSVQGLGPTFKVKVKIQNISKKVLRDLFIVAVYPAAAYRVPKSILGVPFILPSMISTYEILVERVDDSVADEGIDLRVVAPDGGMFLASVAVKMPDAASIGDAS
uniref:Uncharacterized protein TCIL3000_9_4290 n=1 Tax=Trypanosoma congolense (strain IL3000) TaxID=1068625 RepID=G0UUG5_TRYCI|nr:unnamed protein product [Trypanosoma congolense IL3000]